MHKPSLQITEEDLIDIKKYPIYSDFTTVARRFVQFGCSVAIVQKQADGSFQVTKVITTEEELNTILN